MGKVTASQQRGQNRMQKLCDQIQDQNHSSKWSIIFLKARSDPFEWPLAFGALGPDQSAQDRDQCGPRDSYAPKAS